MSMGVSVCPGRVDAETCEERCDGVTGDLEYAVDVEFPPVWTASRGYPEQDEIGG